MKRSAFSGKPTEAAIANALRLVDDEMSKIVAEIAASRAPRPSDAPPKPRAKASREHAHAA